MVAKIHDALSSGAEKFVWVPPEPILKVLGDCPQWSGFSLNPI